MASTKAGRNNEPEAVIFFIEYILILMRSGEIGIRVIPLRKEHSLKNGFIQENKMYTKDLSSALNPNTY